MKTADVKELADTMSHLDAEKLARCIVLNWQVNRLREEAKQTNMQGVFGFYEKIAMASEWYKKNPMLAKIKDKSNLNMFNIVNEI